VLAASVARARCSALFTDTSVVSSSSATSLAFQRSTSRRMSTARCFGGRCSSAATNATRIASRVDASSAGSSVGCTARPSVIGSTQGRSLDRTTVARSPGAGPDPIGNARRVRPCSMSSDTLVAIRYSHERSDERPSKRSWLVHARTIVSWTASSASNDEPSLREQ
jgi:hypothetical protein